MGIQESRGIAPFILGLAIEYCEWSALCRDCFTASYAMSIKLGGTDLRSGQSGSRGVEKISDFAGNRTTIPRTSSV